MKCGSTGPGGLKCEREEGHDPPCAGGQTFERKIEGLEVPGEQPSEAELAEKMRDEIRAVAKKYAKHEHLSGWSQELDDMANEIDCVIEDTRDVE